MRLDIDEKLIKEAQAIYTGPTTTGSGLVSWILRAFADRDVIQIQANMGRRSDKVAEEGM